MKNKKVLEEMLEIYGYPKIDWMGYKFSSNNYVSFHHIDEKRNGGCETIDNGALLSRTSHVLLHIIEHCNYELYMKWQCLFIDFNACRRPLNEYQIEEIMELRKETKDFFISLNKPKYRRFTL